MHLSTHRLPHGELVKLARNLAVSTRTLRNWRGREGDTGSPGHPRHSDDARAHARNHTESAWRSLPRGQNGWRSVREVLIRMVVQVPTRLVQENVRALKREAAVREQARITANRVHVDVLARDAIWALDQTHVMQDERGQLTALAVRDGLSPHVLGLSIGSPACGVDVVRLLQQTAQAREAWPFVIQMDNGSENKNADVAECLREARVIVLWNEPRTPQHNARAERAFGSLKLAVGLEKGGPLLADPAAQPTRETVCASILDAWRALDARTPRKRLGGLTPVELDRIAPWAEDRACRARFYAEVREELQRIALVPLKARARRKREREAIWCALERYGLVKRTRGGCSVPTFKAEGIS